jgi:hypothetical protein
VSAVRSVWRSHGGAALSYVVLSVLFLTPLSLDPLHRVAFIGDSISFIYFPIDNVSRLLRDPLNLFQSSVAFPHASASLLEAHRLGFGLFMAPVSALTGSPVLAANLATILVYLANGLSARWMASSLGVPPLGAWMAGALFAFNTYAVNEQPRPHILFQAFLPVALLHLGKLLCGGRPRHAWWVGAMLLVQAFFESYVAIFGVIMLALTYVLFLVFRPLITLKRTASLAGPAIVTLVMAFPLAKAYVDMGKTYDYSREKPTSMDASHYVATPSTNLVYGAMGPPVRRQQMAPHFIGFVTMALIAVALFTRKRPASGQDTDLPSPAAWIPGLFLLFVFFVVLSLGREIFVGGRYLGPGLFGLLYEHVPVFQSTRIPERYGILAMLFAGVLSGRALAVLNLPRVAQAAIVALALGEHVSAFPAYDVLPAQSRFPPVYQWLKDQPDIHAIAEVPIHGEGLVRFESMDMYYQLLHRKPIISAYLSFEPLLTRILRQTAIDVPEAAALQVLRRVGVDTLIVHEGRTGGEAMAQRFASAVSEGRVEVLREFEPQAGALEPGWDRVYRIVETPVFPASPPPFGRRVLDPAWRYVSNDGDPAATGDSNAGTQWILDQPLRGGEFIQINFREPVLVSGIRLPLTRKEYLPTDFAIDGRIPGGEWAEITRYRPLHRLQLVEALMKSPGRAAATFDLGPTLLTGVRLRALAGATSFEGWRLSEVEVLTPDARVTRQP